MPTYVIRHGYRLSYEFDKETIESGKLKNIEYINRYTQTDGIDEPIGPRGHSESIKTGTNLSKILDFSKPIKVYCSPMTRCVQTAIHIVDELRKKNSNIRICIEYNLAEKLHMERIYNFKNDEVNVK
jgi:phosphohistidine phosphatase SixA